MKALSLFSFLGFISAAAQGQRMQSPAKVVGHEGYKSTVVATADAAPASILVEPYPDTQPEFPGDVRSYLADHLIVSETTKDSGFDGRVVFQFIVGADGWIKSATLKKSSGDPAWDSSMTAMILAMPQWKPATKGSKPVAAAFSLPMYICLE